MIDSSVQEELRMRFNPDGSKLREFQMRLCDLLLEFDRICKDHGIEYWLSSGNVLGAVRHGGFIPWDDDVDIEMTLKDYKKFEKVFKENSRYVLQSFKTDPYYPLNTPKFRDKRGGINEDNGCNEWQKFNGAFIDIFIIEKTFANISHALSWGASMQRWIYRRRNAIGIFAKPICRLLNITTHILIPIMRVICKPLPLKKLRHCYGGGFHHSERCKEDIFPLGQLKFEGHSFPAPGNADRYLSRMYGDYMKLPKFDNIHQHFSNLSESATHDEYNTHI